MESAKIKVIVFWVLGVIMTVCNFSSCSKNDKLKGQENKPRELSKNQIKYINNNTPIFNPTYYSKDAFYVMDNHLWFGDKNKLTIQEFDSNKRQWYSNKEILLKKDVPEKYQFAGSFLNLKPNDTLYNSTNDQILQFEYNDNRVKKIVLKSGHFHFIYHNNNCLTREFVNEYDEKLWKEVFCYSDNLELLKSHEHVNLQSKAITKDIFYYRNGLLNRREHSYKDGENKVIRKTESYDYDNQNLLISTKVINHNSNKSKTRYFNKRILSFDPLTVEIYNEEGRKTRFIIFDREGFPSEIVNYTKKQSGIYNQYIDTIRNRYTFTSTFNK